MREILILFFLFSVGCGSDDKIELSVVNEKKGYMFFEPGCLKLFLADSDESNSYAITSKFYIRPVDLLKFKEFISIPSPTFSYRNLVETFSVEDSDFDELIQISSKVYYLKNTKKIMPIIKDLFEFDNLEFCELKLNKGKGYNEVKIDGEYRTIKREDEFKPQGEIFNHIRDGFDFGECEFYIGGIYQTLHSTHLGVISRFYNTEKTEIIYDQESEEVIKSPFYKLAEINHLVFMVSKNTQVRVNFLNNSYISIQDDVLHLKM
jgi:hypothetical protein